jgi:hypothetical protein
MEDKTTDHTKFIVNAICVSFMVMLLVALICNLDTGRTRRFEACVAAHPMPKDCDDATD